MCLDLNTREELGVLALIYTVILRFLLADTAFSLWLQEDYMKKDHSCCDFVYYLVAGTSNTYTVYDGTCNE